MNRVNAKFRELAKRGKKAFIPYVTAGDPSLKMTEELVLALEEAGADMIELGIPFSDPLSDGPVIQAASLRALQNGTNIEKIFQLVARLRKRTQIPLLLMTSYNPVFHYGEFRFVAKSKEASVDGFIIPDLPPHEAETLIAFAKKVDIVIPFFLSPTTTTERMNDIIKDSTGFIYYVSLTGVTGMRRELPNVLRQEVLRVKRMTDKPVCIGFGISTSQHVLSLAEIADGVIVGSAIVKEIEKNLTKKDLVKKVSGFVQGLTRVL